MSFTCSGPRPSVADAIREKFARDGEVPLSFLRTLLPQEDEMALMELATDLNADHRGTVEQSSHYAPLARELRQQSPFLARFKRLAESATQWCLLSGCKEEKSNALAGMGKEEWNPGDDLSPSEAQQFIQMGFTLFQNSPLSAHHLIPSLARAIGSLPKEEQEGVRQKLKAICKPFVWHDEDDLRTNAQAAFGVPEEELVSMAEDALRQGQQNIRALEFLAILSWDKKSRFQNRAKQQLAQYESLVQKNPENPFFNFAARFASFNKGALGKVDEYLEKAIRLDPNNPHYLYYSLMSDPEQRSRVAKKLVSLAPSNAKYQQILGYALSVLGRNEEAVEAYKMGAKKTPWFYLSLGITYLKLGKEEEAKEAFKKLVDFYPMKLVTLLGVADVYQKNKKFHEAIGYLKKALELEPTEQYSWQRLAECYLGLKNLNEAAKAYEMVERLRPGKALQYLSEIYRKQKNQEKLIATLVKITKQKKATAEDFENLAQEYMEAQKFKEAAQAYEGAVKAEPGNVQYYRDLANNYSLAHEEDKTISTLQKAVTLFPKDSDLQWSLGMALAERDRNEEAIIHLEKALRLGLKNNPRLFDYLGHAYLALKKYPQAEQAYKKAIKLYTDEKNNFALDIWRNLGRLYLILNRFPEAADAFTKAKEQVLPIDLLKALRGAGRLNEALKKAEGLLQENPSDQEILFQYALIQRDHGDLIAATVALKKIVDEVDPNASKEIFETLEKVYRARGMKQEADIIYQRWMEKMLQVQK